MKKLNLRYELATNGLEALKAYQEGAPKFDAILMGKRKAPSYSIFFTHTFELRRILDVVSTKSDRVTDMSMPIMDGMSATRAIRQYERTNNLPRCSIVALTGLASPSAKLEAWNSGIDHFMTKPINFKALEQLLNSERRTRTISDVENKVEQVYNDNSKDGAIS